MIGNSPVLRRGRVRLRADLSNIRSGAAMPTMDAYSASKFALEGITEALYYEMRPWNVTVSLIQPGLVRSNSFKNVYTSEQGRAAVDGAASHANDYLYMSRFIADLMNRSKATPECIAAKIVHLMERPRPQLRVLASLDARFFAWMKRLIPRRI